MGVVTPGNTIDLATGRARTHRKRMLRPAGELHLYRPDASGGGGEPMEQRVSLVTLGVADLGRALAFYQAMGWEPASEVADDVAFFQAGGMVVALWDRAKLAEDSAVEDGGGWGGVTLALNFGSPAEVDA